MSLIASNAPDDQIQPFMIDNSVARGRLVRLGSVVQDVLAGHAYPEPVAALLGEMLALTSLMSVILKSDGVLSVQAKGDGPVPTIVADVTHDRAMRGYARIAGDAETLARLADMGSADLVARLLGRGYLSFTLDLAAREDRYQGIVELSGASLTECAHAYFRQSEQIDAMVRLAAARVGHNGSARWRAAGFMLQRLPPSRTADGTADDENWRRAVALAGSASTDELLDPDLHPHDLLYRLFHEDGVRVFTPQALTMRCRCSDAKVHNMLRAFPRAEIESLKVGDQVVVDCEFCGRRYEFDGRALDAVYAGS
jgi:molecular chaperone Hsp33